MIELFSCTLCKINIVFCQYLQVAVMLHGNIFSPWPDVSWKKQKTTGSDNTIIYTYLIWLFYTSICICQRMKESSRICLMGIWAYKVIQLNHQLVCWIKIVLFGDSWTMTITSSPAITIKLGQKLQIVLYTQKIVSGFHKGYIKISRISNTIFTKNA